MDWLFEVVFDYGEGHCDELPLDSGTPASEQHRFVNASVEAQKTWSDRPDPFSNYRAGFEIRTHRRCYRILMFHRFAELGPEPCLVRSVDFDYQDLCDYSDYNVIGAIAAETEITHQGSTSLGSFVQNVIQSGYVRDEISGRYLKQSLPPLQFEYSKAKIDSCIYKVQENICSHVPLGIDGSIYQWVDLDGEGMPGILTRQGGAWHYKRNLGEGRFAPIQTLRSQPSLHYQPSGREQLLDLAGEGHVDLVSFTGPAPGYYERTDDKHWEPFREFRELPNISWNDPNLQFIDLDGDGHADILITQGDQIVWYPSRGKDGFGAAQTVRCPGTTDEEGPRLVFADGTQSIYLADMNGDGLADLVRIRNRSVCYWPNLGYGRFGAKVTMDYAPQFDSREEFNQKRIRLADVDGSGTTDIIYLYGNVAHVYFNRSGNSWSAKRVVPFPGVYDRTSVAVVDLLGKGTACLVWSSPYPQHMQRPLRYVDLMGGVKPHLLVKVINNLGAETHIKYAASTKFYRTGRKDMCTNRERGEG
jgi:hypothetical protein